jgi:hypothetical protein
MIREEVRLGVNWYHSAFEEGLGNPSLKKVEGDGRHVRELMFWTVARWFWKGP